MGVISRENSSCLKSSRCCRGVQATQRRYSGGGASDRMFPGHIFPDSGIRSRSHPKPPPQRKAINTLFPCVVHVGKGGQELLVNACSHPARAPNSAKFMWDRIRPRPTTPFDEWTRLSLKMAITLASPHVPWHDRLRDENMVTRWTALPSENPLRRLVSVLAHCARRLPAATNSSQYFGVELGR